MTDPKARLLTEIARDLLYTRDLTGKSALSPRVAAALQTVPRERFTPAHLQGVAYDNAALPIGHGQTLSQPYMVALMTELLDPAPDARILEIGTGSGYQTALLAHLAGTVYSVERLPELSRQASHRLAQLGLAEKVHLRIGEGWEGWPEEAPFDGIMVTAAPSWIPAPLKSQLRPGGRMVIPVGPARGEQMLQLVERQRDGSFRVRELLPVAFVPLVPPAAEKG